MNKFILVAFVFGVLAASASSLFAQEQGGPPNVLVVARENVKLGKDAGHERNEAAFARAMASLKRPDHYLAATTVTGSDEAVFFAPFDSFAKWEAAINLGDEPKSRALLGPLMEKDSDYISDFRQAVFTYNEKLSYHASVNIGQMRYFQVLVLQVRNGHGDDWAALAALYNSALAKTNSDEHHAVFDAAYGAPEGTVLIIIPRKSLAEIDAAAANDQAFLNALGPDGQKKLAQLEEAAVEPGARIELLKFDPAMSYPQDAWVQADLSFWKPKPTAKPAAKAATKPAATN
jgi:hypothetical protein